MIINIQLTRSSHGQQRKKPAETEVHLESHGCCQVDFRLPNSEKQSGVALYKGSLAHT